MIEILDSSDDDEQGQQQQRGQEQDEEAAPPPSDRRSSNPFAAFAFEDGLPPEPTPPAPGKKRPRQANAASSTQGKRHECGPPENFEALGQREREAVHRKWASIVRCGSGSGSGVSTVDNDDEAFRLLASVILSSRTQEAVVRQAVGRMAAMPGGFTLGALAALDPEDTSLLHERISFVHCNKVKARHIVLSARRIRDELGGRVPRDMAGLLTIHGIGPTLAPLLVFLFKHHHEEQTRKEKEKAKDEAGGSAVKAAADQAVKGPVEVEVVVLDDTPSKKQEAKESEADEAASA